jgi:hypothetical protein
VLDAMGMAAVRLAMRASSAGLSKSAQETIAAQLDAAQRQGIRFESTEREGSMRMCYEGELFSRILAIPSASAEHKARAVLALTDRQCDDPLLAIQKPLEQAKQEEWRAKTLDLASSQDLPVTLKNRLHLRRASVWSTVAFDRSRHQVANAQQAAQRALDELAAVDKADLPDDDLAVYNDAIMRVNASRWAAQPASESAGPTSGTHIRRVAGKQPGQSCVQLAQADKVLTERCTFGQVWTNSWSMNREGTAGALAVQTMAAWREMWVFRKQSGQWSIDVLVPAATMPDTGYAELAGWVQGGEYMLVAREARGEGKYLRSYDVMEISSLSVKRRASDPSLLAAFQKWQQPQWKQSSVSQR